MGRGAHSSTAEQRDKLQVPGFCEMTTQFSTQAFWRDQELVLFWLEYGKVGEGWVQSEAQDIL